MAFYQNTAEGGSNGVAVTNLNSGGESGNNFNQVTVTGDGSVAFANNTSSHGSMSYRITGGSGSTAKVYMGPAGTATSEGALRTYVRFNALPSAGQALFQIQNTAFASAATVYINVSNRLELRNAGGTVLFTASEPVAVDTWYRVELQVVVGSTATDGTIRLQYFSADSTTPIEQYQNTSTNAGAVDAQRLHIGKHDSAPTLDINVDSLAFQNSAVAIGPYVENTNTAPLANAGSDQTNIEPYSTATLNGSASSDPDGTITDYNWVQTAGSPSVVLSGTGATRTFTAPATIAGTQLTFGLTVTDDSDEQSVQDTVSVTILPVTERAVVGGVEVPAQLTSVQN